MTTATHWTINTIQAAMTADGSYWWEPQAMRFFGTRAEPEVFQGPGGVYFVTSEKPPDRPRAYTIRQFDPSDADVSTVGELCGWPDARTAKDEAERLASGAEDLDEGAGAAVTIEDHEPISDTAQLVTDVRRHAPGATITEDMAAELQRKAARHHRLCEQVCGDGEPGQELRSARASRSLPLFEAQLSRWVRTHIGGEVGVHTSRDPRGCTVKLTFPDRATNGGDREGWCIPRAGDDEADT